MTAMTTLSSRSGRTALQLILKLQKRETKNLTNICEIVVTWFDTMQTT